MNQFLNFSLEGKVALVTGASYGIGFAIASAFAEQGAKVCFNDINQELVDKGMAAYAAKGIKAHGYVCDVTVSFNSLFSIGSHAFVYQLLVDVVKTYSSALFCVSRSNCKTDTVRSTCNESYFTFQRKIQILIHNFFVVKLRKLL